MCLHAVLVLYKQLRPRAPAWHSHLSFLKISPCKIIYMDVDMLDLLHLPSAHQCFLFYSHNSVFSFVWVKAKKQSPESSNAVCQMWVASNLLFWKIVNYVITVLSLFVNTYFVLGNSLKVSWNAEHKILRFNIPWFGEACAENTVCSPQWISS